MLSDENMLSTGAGGRIGREVYKALQGRYAFTLCDLRAPDYNVLPNDAFVAADLSDAATAEILAAGRNAIIHLAGIPDKDASFEALPPANILATTYLMNAAAFAKCRRFVLAGSAQTIESYALE